MPLPQALIFLVFNYFPAKLLIIGQVFATVPVSLLILNSGYLCFHTNWVTRYTTQSSTLRIFPHCCPIRHTLEYVCTAAIVHFQLTPICKANHLINYDLAFFYYLYLEVQDPPQSGHSCELRDRFWYNCGG